MYHRPSSEGLNFYAMDQTYDKEINENISQYVSQFEPRFRKAAAKAYIDGMEYGLRIAKEKIDKIWKES